MAKEICTVCGREIDSRGMSGHMRTHKGKKDDTNGEVISYPSNEQEIEETDTLVDLDESPSRGVKKQVKKQVKKKVKPASKPASSPASSPANKPDPRGQLKTETEHKKEWRGLFRD